MDATKRTVVLDDIDQLVALIADGDTIVVPADYGGAPAAAARAIVRRNSKRLRLVGGPPSGYVADLLIGAKCVTYLEMPGVILGDFGLAPRFRDYASNGLGELRDTTCPAFHTAIQAAQKGLPFIPMRGLIGSDILKNQPDWKIIQNPFASSSDSIVLIPALIPDVVLFHALYGDKYGNVWIGKAFEVMAMAQAGKKVLATFEKFYDGDLLDDKHLAPATVSRIYMDATVHIPNGAWPVAFGNEYPFDAKHMTKYASLAKSDDGFSQYLNQFVFSSEALS